MDRWAWSHIIRVSFSIIVPVWCAVVAAWYFKAALWVVYAGIGVVGFFGVGYLPLAIDFGVQLALLENPSDDGAFYAAVNGLIFMATNSFGIATLYALQPSSQGKVLGCPRYAFAFFMTAIIALGATLVATIPSKTKR